MYIAITGSARAGKDTFAEMFAEEMFNATKKRFILTAYAQELKSRLQKDFDLSYAQLWGDEKETEDHRYPKSGEEGVFWTAREIMQFIGTECMRAVDTNFWIKALFRRIDDCGYENVIITDIRFPDEADPVVERGGYVIEVTSKREGKEIIHGMQHSSETAMEGYSKIDFSVCNDGSLSELRSTAKQVVQFLIKSERMKEKLED